MHLIPVVICVLWAGRVLLPRQHTADVLAHNIKALINYSFKVFLILALALCLKDFLPNLEGSIAQFLFFFDEKPIYALHYIKKAEDGEQEIENNEAKMDHELLIARLVALGRRRNHDRDVAEWED